MFSIEMSRLWHFIFILNNNVIAHYALLSLHYFSYRYVSEFRASHCQLGWSGTKAFNVLKHTISSNDLASSAHIGIQVACMHGRYEETHKFRTYTRRVKHWYNITDSLYIAMIVTEVTARPPRRRHRKKEREKRRQRAIRWGAGGIGASSATRSIVVVADDTNVDDSI